MKQHTPLFQANDRGRDVLHDHLRCQNEMINEELVEYGNLTEKIEACSSMLRLLLADVHVYPTEMK